MESEKWASKAVGLWGSETKRQRIVRQCDNEVMDNDSVGL